MKKQEKKPEAKTGAIWGIWFSCHIHFIADIGPRAPGAFVTKLNGITFANPENQDKEFLFCDKGKLFPLGQTAGAFPLSLVRITGRTTKPLKD